MKVLIALSGGLDSAVLMAQARVQNADFQPVTFVYPSKHNALEVAAARDICHFYNKRHHVVDITDAFVYAREKSSLTDNGQSIPEGHYDNEEMESTVVPGRNLIFAAVLASIGQSLRADQIWMGMHSGDFHIYPDCRPQWVDGVRRAVITQSQQHMTFIAPLLGMEKEDIVKAGIKSEAPFELTRTCYTSNDLACGKCGSCQERLEAFEKNNFVDPLAYASRTLFSKG